MSKIESVSRSLGYSREQMKSEIHFAEQRVLQMRVQSCQLR